MTLILRNLQKTVHFDLFSFEKNINLLRGICGVDKLEMAVTCVESEEIQTLNRKYRGLDEATDVLAFPFLQCDKPGELPDLKDTPDDFHQLGDLVLGLPYIEEQCHENNQILCNVLPVMISHGICHLVGYDHETKAQWKQMYKAELDILGKFNHITGKNCQPLLGIGH